MTFAFPTTRAVNRMAAAQIPAQISNSAGTYVCNHLFYRVRHHLEKHAPHISAGFVHLPYLPAQTTNKPEGTPSLPLETMVRGMELLVQTCEDKARIIA